MENHGHFKRWGAIYILLALFLASWVAQFFFQLAEVSSQQSEHGQPFQWSEFLATFFSATFENWQSEWLQLVFQGAVLLGMKHQLFKADAQDEENLERKLDEILAKLGSAENH